MQRFARPAPMKPGDPLEGSYRSRVQRRRPPPVLIDPLRAHPGLSANDVADDAHRRPHAMLADIVGKAFWPYVHAIRALGRTVRLPAHPAQRYTCLDPGDAALLQVRDNKVPFSFVPVLVHEVRDARPPRLSVAFPVPDEGDR